MSVLQLWKHEADKTGQNTKQGATFLLSDAQYNDAEVHWSLDGNGRAGVWNNIPTDFTDPARGLIYSPALLKKIQ